MDNRTLLNPNFIAPDTNSPALVERHRAIYLAHDVAALVCVARKAMDSDLIDTPTGRGNIELTLEIAEHMASDLVVHCDKLTDAAQTK